MKSVISNLLRHRWSTFIGATCIALTLSLMSAGAQTGITYVYDEVGRLIAVIDPAGDTARYSYDAVGNVLSISRYSSSTLSLISFSPTSGPIGSNITIYGTACSTTTPPKKNTFFFSLVPPLSLS